MPLGFPFSGFEHDRWVEGQTILFILVYFSWDKNSFQKIDSTRTRELKSTVFGSSDNC